jgi:ubiquinone/menaquinone biosynthesis C-methylase UbiE
MSEPFEYINEQTAAKAFSVQSAVFDQSFSANPIVQYKRQRVRQHIQQYVKPGHQVLELNCGTGEDALWLARYGCRVHATDFSTGMLNELNKKITAYGLENKISTELCSFTQLERLSNKGPYDFIFSNFAGLNCTDRLDKVLASFPYLLNPGGVATLVVLPGFCLWEVFLLFKGKFNTAFRRFFSHRGRKANIEGVAIKCWYYNPSYIIGLLKNDFGLLDVEGLCTLVPPSYMENFPEKHPRLYRWLQRQEEKWKNRWPWKHIGDYYIISLKKKSTSG